MGIVAYLMTGVVYGWPIFPMGGLFAPRCSFPEISENINFWDLLFSWLHSGRKWLRSGQWIFRYRVFVEYLSVKISENGQYDATWHKMFADASTSYHVARGQVVYIFKVDTMVKLPIQFGFPTTFSSSDTKGEGVKKPPPPMGNRLY